MTDLRRFREIQSLWMPTVKSELKKKEKKTHWIWFIFPQLKWLGASDNSEYFGLEGTKDARNYFKDWRLRRNLLTCFSIVMSYDGADELKACLGELDSKKFHSCATLFYMATRKSVFKRAIDKFFNGVYDEKTLTLLERGETKCHF